jgi:hypothetical protein
MPMTDDLRNIQRQAFSGMMWTKQHYYFIWDQWAKGDPSMPPPPPNRMGIRNSQWKHSKNPSSRWRFLSQTSPFHTHADIARSAL